ncbi:hypothetical protein [Arenibacter troitsensis]|uniref:Uncharacterized protein n=1 Tax=Arenibacter troitsensis TaxID=188872 RepID=A0A1X7LE58_9FLAO|nr:hypothetical protein [Arenibacter troitsensis]MDX1768528.1 hypothetical protein [Arenibacter troitsensis]SMG51449.1 hypothetical protein SAMN03080602_04087 [Arenibacter troitsensis]
MENQYCKVGSVSTITNAYKEISFLEHQYQSFMDKASSTKYSNSKLAEFFELKAAKIQKIIQTLAH